MSNQVFQFITVLHPTEKELEDGVQAEIINEVTTILASDKEKAQVLAARAIPDEYVSKLDRVEVLLRPF